MTSWLRAASERTTRLQDAYVTESSGPPARGDQAVYCGCGVFVRWSNTGGSEKCSGCSQ